jgi:site-specific DNA-methyltransferase (adenine-specific)
MYRRKGIRLYQGDCFALLPKFRKASVDLILTDPPYGSTDCKWDRKIDVQRMWLEFNRIAKPTAMMVIFAAQPFATDVINANRKHFRYDLIWEKPRAVGFLDARRRPLRAHEHILVFSREFKGSIYNPQMTEGKPYVCRHGDNSAGIYGTHRKAVTINNGTRYPRSVLLYSNINRPSLHSTQKPLDLVKYLILTFSKPGDLILDAFAGSGTTLVAARQLQRRAIGIERDCEFVKTGEGRLNAV